MSEEEESPTPPMPALGGNRSTPVRNSAMAASAEIHKQSTKTRRALNHNLLPSQKMGGRPPAAPGKKKAPAKKTTTKKKAAVKKEAAVLVASKRPPNFSSDEDLYICKAFVNVSTDPTVGTGQKGKDFWEKAKDY